ncbi:MAG: ABC transporter ATP-binding protein [Proteobacteria bacterium]|nr:ABC transporter ATP-binding protein [Pseudomonadota bacterium]MCP4918672.1 ABC transporter ATP-binding protein [Pseudomonadota bacterium]
MAATTAALEVKGLRRTYGSRAAVDNLDLCVTEGSVYGFLGPNGAGKTTAMRCILGLIKSDAGSIAIFGETNAVKRRQHVGALVETPRFYEWLSGKKNLEIAAAYAGIPNDQVAPALTRVGLQDRGNDIVSGYSLGMKQRLGIARALLTKPRLLLLDEPTNGLDPQGMKDVRELIAALARDEAITIFISSHLLFEVQSVATRVGIIENGKLIAEGDVDELLAGGDVLEVEVGSTDKAGLSAALADIAEATVIGAGAEGEIVQLTGIDAAELNKRLVAAGVPVSSLSSRGRTLEDLFLSLTKSEIT